MIHVAAALGALGCPELGGGKASWGRGPWATIEGPQSNEIGGSGGRFIVEGLIGQFRNLESPSPRQQEARNVFRLEFAFYRLNRYHPLSTEAEPKILGVKSGFIQPASRVLGLQSSPIPSSPISPLSQKPHLGAERAYRDLLDCDQDCSGGNTENSQVGALHKDMIS